MARTLCADFIEICILQLLLIYTCRLNAAAMTYDTCKSDPSSYQVGGWCFSAYADKSWHSSNFSQNASQFVCSPNGNLAVGVTNKALSVFVNRFLNSTVFYGWTALMKNSSYTITIQGWYWNTRLPNGQYAVLPAVMNNIPWLPGDPDNGQGSEYAGVLGYNAGVGDARDSLGSYGSSQVAAICQFTPRQWNYLQRGHGRFASSSFLIAQITCARHKCIVQCHRSPGCVSLAFNPTTSDCQTYSVSPEDPRFSANVTSDAAYEWHIRDGMEY